MVSMFVLATDNVSSNKTAREHLTQLKQEQMHILTTGIQLNTPPTRACQEIYAVSIYSTYIAHLLPYANTLPLEFVHRCYL